MDSDQYGCLAIRDRVDAGAVPWVDESTPTTALILIYGIAGLCMAATVAVVTGVGMIRLLPPPIEIGRNGERSLPRSKHYAWSE